MLADEPTQAFAFNGQEIDSQIPSHEMRMRESCPIDAVDSSQPEITELVSFVDLLQRVDIHMAHEIPHESFPPVPGDKAR